MTSEIELHDSVIQRCSDVGGEITIRIAPAILHRSEGRPGVDAGSVYTIALDLIFHGGNIEIPFSQLPTDLWEGSLVVDGKCIENCLPFPFDLVGPVSFRCVECAGNTAVITGTSLSIVPASEEEFVEHFPGIDD